MVHAIFKKVDDKMNWACFACNSRHQHEEDDREVHVGWRLRATPLKRTSRRPDQGKGGGRELKKVDMNSAQVFTLGFFAIHKNSIPSTTPFNKNCQSLSSTSVKSGCMDDKKKPN